MILSIILDVVWTCHEYFSDINFCNGENMSWMKKVGLISMMFVVGQMNGCVCDEHYCTIHFGDTSKKGSSNGFTSYYDNINVPAVVRAYFPEAEMIDQRYKVFYRVPTKRPTYREVKNVYDRCGQYMLGQFGRFGLPYACDACEAFLQALFYSMKIAVERYGKVNNVDAPIPLIYLDKKADPIPTSLFEGWSLEGKYHYKYAETGIGVLDRKLEEAKLQIRCRRLESDEQAGRVMIEWIDEEAARKDLVGQSIISKTMYAKKQQEREAREAREKIYSQMISKRDLIIAEEQLERKELVYQSVSSKEIASAKSAMRISTEARLAQALLAQRQESEIASLKQRLSSNIISLNMKIDLINTLQEQVMEQNKKLKIQGEMNENEHVSESVMLADLSIDDQKRHLESELERIRVIAAGMYSKLHDLQAQNRANKQQIEEVMRRSMEERTNMHDVERIKEQVRRIVDKCNDKIESINEKQIAVAAQRRQINDLEKIMLRENIVDNNIQSEMNALPALVVLDPSVGMSMNELKGYWRMQEENFKAQLHALDNTLSELKRQAVENVEIINQLIAERSTRATSRRTSANGTPRTTRANTPNVMDTRMPASYMAAAAAASALPVVGKIGTTLVWDDVANASGGTSGASSSVGNAKMTDSAIPQISPQTHYDPASKLDADKTATQSADNDARVVAAAESAHAANIELVRAEWLLVVRDPSVLVEEVLSTEELANVASAMGRGESLDTALQANVFPVKYTNIQTLFSKE